MSDDDDETPRRRTPPPPRRRTEPRGFHPLRPITGGDAAPDREFGEDESRSGVIGDPFERIEYRQRNQSRQIELVGARVHALEVKHEGISHELRALAKMTEDLIKVAEDERRTRDDRAAAARMDREAAEARKEREDERRSRERSANRKLIAGIVVPTIAAIGALITSIIAAVNSASP